MARQGWVSSDPSLNPISDLEGRMLEAAETGTKLDLGPTPATITASNQIRARVIERLLRGEEAWKLSGRGLSLEGAGITGELDLSGLRGFGGVPAPALTLRSCHLDSVPNFSGASMDALTLSKTMLPGINGEAIALTRFFDADDVVASGPINLDYLVALGVDLARLQPPKDGSVSVSMSSARIAGELFLQEARLSSPSWALFLDGAETSDVFLDEAIIEGEVRALDAKIRGRFSAKCAHFVNPDDDVLSLDGVEAAGVFLSGGFFNGGVRALNATINGNWAAVGAEFRNPNRSALNLSGATISGGLFLRDDAFDGVAHACHRVTEIHGSLDLIAARVGRLELDGVKITAGSLGAGVAIVARDLIVNGPFYLGTSSDGRQPWISGQLQFSQVTVSGVVHFSGILISTGGTETSDSDSAIELRGATLGGLRIATAQAPIGFCAVPDGRDRDSQDRPWIQKSGAGFGSPAQITGRIDLSGATIRGDIDIDGAVLCATAPDCDLSACTPAEAPAAYAAATALSLHMTQITGALRVRGLTDDAGVGSRGIVDLRGAHCDELDDDGGNGWGIAPDWDVAAGHGGRFEWLKTPPSGASGLVLDLDGFDYRRFEAAEQLKGSRVRYGLPGMVSTGMSGAADALRRLGAALLLPRTVFRWLIGAEPGEEIAPAPDAPLWRRRRHWLERQYRGDRPTAADYAPQPWQHLARVLQGQGKDLDARRITIEHHRFQLRCATDRLVDRAWAYVYGGLAGFGYSPGRALAWATGLATLGVVVVSLGFASDQPYAGARALDAAREATTPGKAATLMPGCANERRFTASADCPFFVARQDPDKPWLVCTEVAPWLFALDVYLPIDLGQESRCDVPEKRHMWGILKLIFALIGWVSVPLAALTFTGILRRN